MDVKIRIEDVEVRRFMQTAADRISPALKKAVRQTAIFGLREIKTKLPKRSGGLRQSYGHRAAGEFGQVIESGLPKQAEALEAGHRAFTVVPRHAKMLTIPIRDDVLTSTKAQIKKSSLDKLFRRLKNRKKGETNHQIYDEVGIVMAKKARIPATKGTRQIEREIVPAIDRELTKNVESEIREIMNA